jgi:outer membrane protein
MSRYSIFSIVLLVMALVVNSAPVQGRNVFSLASDAPATPADTVAPRVLTLEDCFGLAKVNNIGLQRVKLGIQLSMADRMRAESIFDPLFQADLTGTGTSGGQTSTSGDSNTLDLGVKYTVPTDLGGAWDVSFDQSRSNGSVGSGLNALDITSYSSRFGLGYTVELLEGSNQYINRLGIKQADIGILRSEASVNDTARALRSQIVNAFIGAVIASRQIEVDQSSLDNAKNLVETVQARIDAGKTAPYELLSAQAGLAQREESLINSKTQYKNALDSLKNLVGLPITDEISVDAGILRSVTMQFDPNELFVQAQNYRPDYLDIDLRTRQAQLTLQAAHDKVRPTLAWNTQVGLTGQDTNSFDSLGNMNKFGWTTGLQYSIPLGGNEAAVATETSARINIQQLDLERTDFLRTLLSSIRAAVENFNNAVLRIDVATQGLKVQQTNMENDKARLKLGLITSRDLLLDDVNLATAQMALNSAMGDALTSLGTIEFLTGQTMLEDVLVMHGATEQAPGAPE